MTSDQEYNGPGRTLAHAGRHIEGAPPAEASLDLKLVWSSLTDLGNSERLRARSGDEMVHTLEHGWRVYDGVRWNGKDGNGQAQICAHRAAVAIKREVAVANEAGAISREGQQALERHARQSQNSGRLKAMLDLSEAYQRRQIEEFDAAPHLLNTPAGTLELGATGSPCDIVSLRSHDRADLITRCTAANYDPDADATLFGAFITRILPNNEVRLFVQRYFGYAATGDSGEQIMALFYGRGANGKSVLLNIIRGVLGDYCVTLPFSSLTGEGNRGGGDATPDLARLPGARFVTASEPKAGTRLDEGMIKALTGGEPMMVRAMYHNPFEFVPTHKIVLSFNNKPKVHAQDEGTWRRMAMVPFEVTIPLDERDPMLADRILEAEAPGVLNWILDGVRMYRERGLDLPVAVCEATQAYRGESDPVGPFIDAALERADGCTVLASVLFLAYTIWAKRNGLEPITRNRFGLIMTEKGYQKEKAGVYSYVDVRLIDEYQEFVDQEAGMSARADPVPPGVEAGDPLEQEEPPI